jgi:hypothetical protein
MMGYILSFRFLFWLLVGGGVTWAILYRKGREPLFGSIVCGVLGGFGGIILLGCIWLYMWYMMPSIPRIYRAPNPRTRSASDSRHRWKIRW